MSFVTRFILLSLTLLSWQGLAKTDGSDTDKENLPFRIVTTEYSPYSYLEKGEPQGYSVALINAMLSHVDFAVEGAGNTQIEIMPWARSYKTALNRPNTLIFSIARTPEREPYFFWIGKLFPMKTFLYADKARKDIKLSSLDDARNYTVAGVIEGAPSKWLESQGFRMLKSSGVYESRIRMLLNNRIDLLLSDPMSLETEMQNASIGVHRVRPVLYLPEPSYDLYVALSRGSNKVYLKGLLNAYQAIIENGKYQALTQPFHDRYRSLSVMY